MEEVSQEAFYRYIEEYAAAHYQVERPLPGDAGICCQGLPSPEMIARFQRMNAGPSFHEALLAMIDQQRKKDAEVYRRADVSKGVFSKIRSGQHPDKKTAVRLVLALELSLAATQKLLDRAGYSLSNAIREDLIVQACIEAGCYDIDRIRLYIADEKVCADIPSPSMRGR